jgi:hypothetical protein
MAAFGLRGNELEMTYDDSTFSARSLLTLNISKLEETLENEGGNALIKRIC